MIDDRRLILAVDGGGVRGVIPATLLASLEAATGRSARDSFDFLAGTSVGAVIVGGLGAGISPSASRQSSRIAPTRSSRAVRGASSCGSSPGRCTTSARSIACSPTSSAPTLAAGR